MERAELEQRLLGDICASPALLESVRRLCDEFGGRFAGARDERRAGDFLYQRLSSIGLANVAFEAFMMRGWRRGGAQMSLLRANGRRDTPCLGLPGSPPRAVDARLADVGLGVAADFERLGEAVRDCIVLADAGGPHRLETYARSCAAGAVGFVFAHNRPGMLIATGSLSWGHDAGPLPGVGVSFETASFLRREAERGDLRLALAVNGEPRMVEARNVVGEIPRREPGAGWIIVCAHYDGHDIAQAAQDNASGTAVVLEAARVLAPLREHLRSGIRFCLFSGEEMGLHGSSAYVRAHSSELDQVRAVLNADVVGLASPLLLEVQNSPELAACLSGPCIKGLDALVTDQMVTAHSDHFPFVLAGVPACTIHSAAPANGDWTHTAADTLDKLDLGELQDAAGALARILLRLAMAPDELPTGRQPRDAVRRTLVDAGLEDSLRLRMIWPF